MVRRIRDYPYTRQYIDTTPYLYHVQQLATWGLGPAAGRRSLGRIGLCGGEGTANLVRRLPISCSASRLPAAILVASSSVTATVLSSAIAVGALVVTNSTPVSEHQGWTRS